MSRKEVDLEKQVELLVRTYDQRLAMQIGIMGKREDVAHYQSLLSSSSLSKIHNGLALNELKNSSEILRQFEKNNDHGVKFTHEFALLLDALNKSPPQEYERSKQAVLVLLDQFEKKFVARKNTMNELSPSASYELYQQHDLNVQTLVQVLSDLDNKVSNDLVAQIDKFQKLLKSPDLDYDACVRAIAEINELLDRFSNKDDLPVDMKNLLVLLDKQYEAFYYRGLSESYPELKQACADVAGPLTTVIDRLHAKPPQKITEFIDRYHQAIETLADQYFQQVVLNQEDFQSPLNYIQQALNATDVSHTEFETVEKYAVDFLNHMDTVIQDVSDQVNDLPEGLAVKVNERAENLRAQILDPLLEARVQVSLVTVEEFDSHLDSLIQSVTLAEDQKNLIQQAQRNTSEGLRQPTGLAQKVAIIQTKARVLTEALRTQDQDISDQLPLLQAELTKLVQEDTINQTAQKKAEALGSPSGKDHDISKILNAVGNAMKELFTNVIPALIDSIQQTKVVSKLSTKLTGKQWVSDAHSKLQDQNPNPTPVPDPDKSASVKKH